MTKAKCEITTNDKKVYFFALKEFLSRHYHIIHKKWFNRGIESKQNSLYAACIKKNGIQINDTVYTSKEKEMIIFSTKHSPPSNVYY